MPKCWGLITYGPDGVGMQIASYDEEPVSAPIEENGPMRMNHESSLTPRWIVFGTALVYFALGSLLTVHFMQLKEVWADSHRVFQQQIYHAVPGKVPALERALLQRFCSASKGTRFRHGSA